MSRGLQWITSNRLEALSERLAAAVRTGLRDPLTPELVVVQSLGMARWLQLELARQNGICARIQFPFPKAFLHQICTLVVPEAATDHRFEVESMTWRIWSRLALDDPDPALAEPRRYAGDDPRRRFQLSTRLATLFDQYLVYRPDLINRWDAGEDESWQPALWRALSGGPEAWPESRLLTTAAKRLVRETFPELPQRVAVFGISALPPVYLELLAALAESTEVTLYQLQACREYWGDTVSSREEQRTLRRAGRRADEGAALNLDRGHRLLTSFGRLGRSFLAQLAEHGAGAEEDPDYVAFPDPGSDTLLHTVQADLLNLFDRSAPEAIEDRLNLEAEEVSLQIHSCHSPRRELEVLYDQLLAAFDADPGLAPRDVLVLTPDIEAYAPLIQAIFGAPEDERMRLPFTVADRAPRVESSLADSFLRLLQLPGRRFGRSEILPLFERPAWQQRFGWVPADLPRLRDWLEELQVSWGLGAVQRGELGLPPLPEGTWRQAADRLLLGYALAPDDELVVGGISPFLPVEGDGAELAGRMAACVSALEQLPVRLAADRPLSDWADDLGLVLDEFFAASPENESDFALVRETLNRLRAAGQSAGVVEPVPLAAVVEQLTPWLGEECRAGGFLRGGVTFAAFKPMRSVPARIIAVLGLNDGAFPRRPSPLSFDLIAAAPRAGDESREADDRYLFLETLLSARDRLHLSYVGRSLRDNADLPPSVVLSELLDYLAGSVGGGEAAVAQALVVRHPLQAFSPAYFGAGSDPRLFSYSRENSGAAQVAHRLTTAAEAGGPFCAVALPEPAGRWRTVDLAVLAKFLVNPARHFLEQRLGLRLPRAEAAPEDREVFTLDSLSAYGMKQEWLERARRGEPTEALAQRLAVDGSLPLGPAGRLQLQQLESRVLTLLAGLSPEERTWVKPVPVALTLGEFVLEGQVTDLTAAGLRRIRPARFNPADLLRLWLGQLTLAAQGAEPPPPARLIVEEERWSLPAPAQAREVLAGLLELYAKGLCRPLPFFPKSAWAFTNPKSVKVQEERALTQWNGSLERSGESADPAFAFCFGTVVPHPLDEEFRRLAQQVCGPIWAIASAEKGTA